MNTDGPILFDGLLGVLSDAVDRLEAQRTAMDNQYRTLTRTEADSDGLVRGFGLTEDVPAVRQTKIICDGIEALEHQAILALQRQVRKHPLGHWIKETVGVGEKQGARLLAVIGDPYWNDLHDRPRLVSELWSYCGMGVVDQAAPRKAKGQRVNWSPAARMRVFLVAESCMKCRTSPYREVYDQARVKYADAVHPVACPRCGPKGKPAEPGSPLSAGHQNARALRMISKAILMDLWLEAKAAHEVASAKQPLAAA